MCCELLFFFDLLFVLFFLVIFFCYFVFAFLFVVPVCACVLCAEVMPSRALYVFACVVRITAECGYVVSLCFLFLYLLFVLFFM